jgi:hypothetical protein
MSGAALPMWIPRFTSRRGSLTGCDAVCLAGGPGKCLQARSAALGSLEDGVDGVEREAQGVFLKNWAPPA